MTIAADRAEQRQRIYARDGGTCGFCGRPVEFARMNLDHILPRIAGGGDEDDNLQLAHPACNFSANAKGHKRPSGTVPVEERRIVQVRLPLAIMELLDRLRKKMMTTRTGVIIQAVRELAKKEGVQ